MARLLADSGNMAGTWNSNILYKGGHHREYFISISSKGNQG